MALYEMSLLSQVFSGFGVMKARRAKNASQAMDVVRAQTLDLIVSEINLPDRSGFDLAQKIRRLDRNPNCFIPIILISGHTPIDSVRKSRDSGANFIINKPFSPAVLLERIIWASQDSRPFVECDSYCGPDRRFVELGPPMGVEERRADQLALDQLEDQSETVYS